MNHYYLKLQLLVATLLLIVIPFTNTNACTSAIITGKATPDGRPLMWKHRDTGEEQNRMIYSTEGKYAYIGLVNSIDKTGRLVWAGTNTTGFCIMNTASYNLREVGDTTKGVYSVGRVMRMALECCSSLSDFEHFLDTLSRPMGLETNLAAIDAFGGAAYYETNDYGYVKVDANDQLLAPHGYLIRSNFSYTGRMDDGRGYIRHETAQYLFSQQRAVAQFTPEWIFSSVDRSYYHSLIGIDLKNYPFDAPGATGFFIDQDFIPRASTSAAIIFKGVLPDELPEHTTMWVTLGFPSCSVAMPMWVKGGDKLPSTLMQTNSSINAPLCEKVVELKHRVFPITRGNGKLYFDWALLYNSNKTGIMQRLEPIENAVFEKSYAAIKSWGNGAWSTSAIQTLYKDLDTYVEKAYQDLFGL